MGIALCPVCHQIGHSEEDCPERRAERAEANARRSSIMVPVTITRRLSLSHTGPLLRPIRASETTKGMNGISCVEEEKAEAMSPRSSTERSSVQSQSSDSDCGDCKK